MEGLENWVPLAGVLTAPGLLLLVAFMVFRGDIIPRKTVERELKTITESRNHWRETSTNLLEANHLLSQAVAKNTEVGQSVVKVMSVVHERLPKEGEE